MEQWFFPRQTQSINFWMSPFVAGLACSFKLTKKRKLYGFLVHQKLKGRGFLSYERHTPMVTIFVLLRFSGRP
jgi:hypothetical protein